MKIEIDFVKQEIKLLEPVSIKEILKRFEQLDVADFKIVPTEEKINYTLK